MKHLKNYKIFEREFSQDWFEKNPNNYVVANKVSKPVYGTKISHSEKTVREWLSEINWEDIEIKEDKPLHGLRYICFYRNTEYFLQDQRLLGFILDTNNFNRIHTDGQVHPTLRGIGLGYKCYKAIINHVGWVRSSEEGTNEMSRNIWKNLIKDKDFYSFEVETNGFVSDSPRGFIVFSKSMNKSEIDKVLKEFKEDGNKIITPDPKFKSLNESSDKKFEEIYKGALKEIISEGSFNNIDDLFGFYDYWLTVADLPGYDPVKTKDQLDDYYSDPPTANENWFPMDCTDGDTVENIMRELMVLYNDAKFYPITRHCAYSGCQNVFTQTNRNNIFCSDECSRNYSKDTSLFENVKFNKQPKKKGAKTDTYNVTNGGSTLGQIRWSSRMRGYSFLPTKDCEPEVKEFVKELMRKRREDKKKSKS